MSVLNLKVQLNVMASTMPSPTPRIHCLRIAAPHSAGSMNCLRPIAIMLITMMLSSHIAIARTIRFQSEIAPWLVESCLDCHRAGKSKGGYRLDTLENLMKPGESGKAPIVPGKPAESHLLQLLRATDPDDRMPQKADPLEPRSIAQMEQWISEGAKVDGPSKSQPIIEWVERESRSPAPTVYPHPIPLTALAFDSQHPESHLWVSGYREVVIWDRKLQQRVERIGGMPERILGMVRLPGTHAMVVTGGVPGRQGEVWWVSRAEGTATNHVKKMLSTPDLILASAISPDGRWLVVGGADQTLRMCQLSNQVWSAPIEAHSDWVMDIAFSEDSARLGSASRDKSAKVFSFPSMELLSTYYEHMEPVWSIVFPPSATNVVTTSRGSQWHVWEVGEAKKKRSVEGIGDDVLRLRTGVKGEPVFALMQRGEVRRYEGLEKPELRETLALAGEEITTLIWDSERGELLTGTERGRVHVWKVGVKTERTGEVMDPLPMKP